MDRTKQTVQQGIPVTSLDAAHANQYFEQFVNATSLKNILGYYRGLIDNLHLRPNYFTLFYPKLKANLTSWRAKALLKKFDSRASHKCYQKGKLASNTRVLVIGGGPCGLRTAIEAQLLGAKVVVVEKRDRFSRNNVLHLWPFVIEDLRMLGAKKFFGKFCAGAIDHISIRQLQCILMKVALLLGVEIHTEVSFEELIEPNAAEKIGWRAQFKPSNHPVSQYEFDVIIGADGKRNTLQGFTRKEFRGKLAIAITANFINKKTEAEARVEEISGVAFIFNQKFFKDLQESTRIDLENIVYYKDDTHYFVMTAKKHSLIEKGVIKQDFPDTERLLASENVDKDALQQYAIEAASFSTNYQMPNLEFAVNHYGQPDIAMFDFTSMYVAENASKVVERSGYRLLKILVGDSLLEPFWPTGSGCARGFLSALDAAWAIRSWSLGTVSPLDVLAERESIYRLLAQTTPDNLNKDWKSYTLDPSTRYPNLNKAFVLPHQVISLYDTDNPASIERMKRSSTERTNEVPKKRRRGIVDNEVLLNWLVEQLKDKEEVDFTDIGSVFKSGKVLCAIIHRYRPDLLDVSAIKNNDAGKNNQIAIDILEKDLGILPVMTGTELTVTEDYLTMASYLTEIYDCFRGEIPYIKHPKLELPLESTKLTEVSYKTIKSAGMPSPSVQVSVHSNRNKHKHNDSHAQRLSNIDKKPKKRRSMEKIGDHENKPSQVSRTSGRDEDIAAKIKHLENKWRQPDQVDKKPKDLMRAIGKIETTDWNIKEIEKKILENKLGKPSKPNDREKVPKWSKEQFVARQSKMEKQHIDRQNSAEAKFAEIDRSIKNLDQKIKEGTVRELGQNKVASITEKLVGKIQTEPKPVEKNITRQPLAALPTQNASEFCHFCNKRVYLMERLSAEGRFFHHSCFKCQYCHVQLRLGSYTFDRDGLYGHRFFCLQHFGMLGESPSARVVRKHSIKRQNDLRKSPEKKPLPGIAGVDLLDKVQTPERIEFANLSTGNISSDQDDSLNQIDEDEWTDKNFGASCAELDDTDDDSSSISYSDSDDEDAYDDALEEPATKEGTLKWAERWKNSYSRRKNNSDSNDYSSSDQSSYYDSSDDDESETATEGEEEIRARELRKQEVCVEPPIVHTDTGTDTEIVSDETSSGSSSEVHNSATEISTDSEFAQDDPTPTREIPSILLNDFNVTKTRGSGGNYPKKIQVTSRYLQRPSNGKTKKPNIDLKLTPLVPSALSVKKTAPVTLSRPTGYVLNRTQSTGGIAAKVSLELKKKYLLGEPNPGSIQKSGSASTLDTKFKSFHTNISDCQKLLKPSTVISASMQTFCKKLNELQSPVQSSPTIFTKDNAPTEITNTEEIQNISVGEQHTNDVKPEKVFENESEGRPRSPLHETSIIVPQIDWNKQNNILTSDSLASSESDNEADKKRKQFENKPRVEICTEYLNEHTQEDKDQFVPDSLVCVNKETVEIPSNDPPKSITSEKKTLNQPKPLPNLENLLPEIHNSLHIKYKNLDNFSKELSSAKVHSSGVSSPESIAEQVTTALTETELSDWARDGVVSDDFEDEEYESNVKYTNKPVKMADLLEFDESVSKKSTEIPLKDKIVLTQAVNNVLSINLDNIEFMDTGTETSSDDGVANSQNGYVLFKNEDDFAEDSLNPHINDILEATNIHVLSLSKDNKEIPDSDVTQQTQNIVNNDLDDDSVVIIESGTTTEENTLTDSTVKNVTEFGKESPNNNKTTETETTAVNEFKLEPSENIDNSIEFQKHCERLKSKVEFSNVKDSIDIRNSRIKSKPDILYTPDLITEEVSSTTTSKNVSLNLSSAHHTPDILYNKEVIKKERDINQKLIQEMVMNKMKAENKSLERRKRNKMSPSIKSPSDLTKSATATNVLCSYKSIQNTSNKALFSSPFDQPDVLLSTNYPLKNSKSANIDFISSEITYTTPSNVGLKPTPIQKTPDNSDIPKPPSRYNKTPEEMNKKLEKLKQQVRLRNKENEHLLLNRHKFENNQRKEAPLWRCVSGNYESALFSSTAAHDSYSSRAKSTPDFPNKLMAVHPIIIDKDRKKIYKSDPNILESHGNKNKTKSQDREQRKSLTKLLTGLFSKKSSSSKGLFSKLSPKSKEVSKSCTELDYFRKEPLIYNDRKSLSESYIARNLTPPPIPPLPVNYVKKADDSSDDDGLKKRNDSSCDTLDFTGASIGSVSVRKSTKSRRTSRQAQLKRHRMAQEIQRKLEETEVKMKELENRGVSVEKALRGEDNSYKDEPELLQEWFDLMRDRTELRRYEKELSVRAQELELEDRHARLQYELRERIEDDKPKTKEDLEVEESIINEMIKIVEKRDSLLTEIEEDRLRYSHEDRDLEEQMLAKGLRLTSIKNSPE